MMNNENDGALEGAEELDCSEGAKMLIERMKDTPEEFRGHNARWSVVVNQMLQVRRGGFENNIMVSKRDMNALFAAFERYVMETALVQHVIEELADPKPPTRKLIGDWQEVPKGWFSNLKVTE